MVKRKTKTTQSLSKDVAVKEINARKEKLEDMLHNIPRGKPKSGRGWKTLRTERYSEIRKVKSLKSSWAEKMRQKSERKSIKDFENRLKDEKDQARKNLRQRREINKKRRLENARKSEIVQPIKNTAKIKRMKKKQLRQIEKR